MSIVMNYIRTEIELQILVNYKCYLTKYQIIPKKSEPSMFEYLCNFIPKFLKFSIHNNGSNVSEAGWQSLLNIYPKSLEYINNYLIDSFIIITWARNPSSPEQIYNSRIPNNTSLKTKTQSNSSITSHTVIQCEVCREWYCLALNIWSIKRTWTDWC